MVKSANVEQNTDCTLPFSICQCIVVFQDVAGNSLGLLPPSFSSAIVDSGEFAKNRQ